MDALKDLRELLLDCFSSVELRMWLRDLFGPASTDELPADGSPIEIADAAVQALRRHGRIRTRLFAALIEVRPARRTRIVEVQRLLIPHGLRPDQPDYPTEESAAVGRRLEAARREHWERLASGADPHDVEVRVRLLKVELKRLLRSGRGIQPGDWIQGRFQLIRRLGAGGFADVWSAVDSNTDQHVAVKILHHQWARDASRRARFFRGARTMGALRHAAVVPVVHVPPEDAETIDYPFFVMDLMQGGDLHTAVVNDAVRGYEAALDVITTIGQVLTHAHETGLVHRDVKPMNILLDAGGKLHLGDFDLVKADDTFAGTRTVAMGTLLYSAPEVMNNAKDATPQSDQYSLAMTSLFVLHGANPPVFSVLRDPAGFAREQHAPPTLLEALVKALSLDPTNRFGTMKTFIAAARGAVRVAKVVAPLSGTLWWTMKPGARPLVELGQEVTLSQVLFMIEAHDLMNEIEAEEDGIVITLKVPTGTSVRAGDVVMELLHGEHAMLGPREDWIPGFSPLDPLPEDSSTVTAPVPGACYLSPDPFAPRFVEVGDRVSIGQTLCIIAAPGLFFELEATREGEIVEIVVQQAAHVDFGDVLFRFSG